MNHYAPDGNKVPKSYFYHKGQGHKVIDLGSFERTSLVEYTWQIWSPYLWSLYLLHFKNYINGLKLKTDKQTLFLPVLGNLIRTGDMEHFVSLRTSPALFINMGDHNFNVTYVVNFGAANPKVS